MDGGNIAGVLHSAWLLSDLDGTLISTPHKACGQYLTLEQSPCLHVIKRWLLNGGNVCIVTTADKRVFHQMYTPLQSILKESSDRGNCGELLLSLYTGATLYRCLSSGVEVVREYSEWTHHATDESVELAELYKLPMKKTAHESVGVVVTGGKAHVHGTCISQDACNVLLELLDGILRTFLEEVLSREPAVLSAFEGMSARYKEMWCLLLNYLDVRCSVESTSGVSSSSPEIGENERKGIEHDKDDFAVAWKKNFFRHRWSLFRLLGMIRVERMDFHMETISMSDFTDLEARKLEARVMHVLGDDSPVSLEFVKAILRLLGPKGHDCNGDNTDDVVNREEVTQLRGKLQKRHSCDVVQVMVLGIPFCLFPRYFERHLESFAKIGVTAIAQPNSVVFSKMGVCKSTAIRYLIGQQQQRMEKLVGGVRPRMYGIVDLSRAVALGDNPHTTDFELTVFPGLPFISFERMEQREKRHKCISNTESLTLNASPTHQRRGPLMDDRRVKNLHYVGGEEHGAAVFLTLLMNALHVSPDAFTPNYRTNDQQVRLGTFASCVLDSAAKASSVLTSSLTSNL